MAPFHLFKSSQSQQMALSHPLSLSMKAVVPSRWWRLGCHASSCKSSRSCSWRMPSPSGTLYFKSKVLALSTLPVEANDLGQSSGCSRLNGLGKPWRRDGHEGRRQNTWVLPSHTRFDARVALPVGWIPFAQLLHTLPN